MTGPIQPLPIPDVRPSYYNTANPGQDRLQRSFQALLAVLQGRNEIEAQKAEQAAQTQAGSMLGSFLADLGTQQVPGLPLAMGGSTLPMTVESPIAKFRGQPGLATYKAVQAGQNVIGPEVARISRAREMKPLTVKDKNAQVVTNEDGYATIIDKNLGTAQLVLDDKGQPVKMPKTGSATPRPLGRYSKNGREYIAFGLPGSTEVQLQALPEGMAPSGAVTEAQSKAAGRYLTSATAFRQAKGDTGLSKDVVQYLLQQVKINGQRPMTQWLAEAALSDDVKRQLLNWTTILQNTVYKNSGAAVTVAEFNRAFQRIPIQGESKELRQRKLDTTRYDIYADYLTARNELARSSANQPEVDIPAYQELWDEPGDPSLTPEQRAKAESDPEYAQFLRDQGRWP